MRSPSGWTRTAIELRQPEISDPNQIPARGETKVFWLLLQSLVTIKGTFDISSYAVCGQSSPLRGKPSGAEIPAVLSSSSWILNSLEMTNSPDCMCCICKTRNTAGACSPLGCLRPRQERVALVWSRGTQCFCGLLSSASVAVGSSRWLSVCACFSPRLGQGRLQSSPSFSVLAGRWGDGLKG